MRGKTANISRRGREVLIGLALAGVMPAGCAKEYTSPMAYTGPTLAADDLGLPAMQCPANGYRVLQTEKTTGRFPTALSVARLQTPGWYEQMIGEKADSWLLGDIPESQASKWNSMFNTIFEIREVKVQDRLSVRRPGPPVSLPAILRAAQVDSAALVLIYGPAQAGFKEAGLIGVIKETATGQSLAVIRAQAGPYDSVPPPADQWQVDISNLDPNELVARRFEKQVWSCMLDIVDMDQPATTTRPSPWLGVKPREADRPYLVLPEQMEIRR